jgi:hypothetical protein
VIAADAQGQAASRQAPSPPQPSKARAKGLRARRWSRRTRRDLHFGIEHEPAKPAATAMSRANQASRATHAKRVICFGVALGDFD